MFIRACGGRKKSEKFVSTKGTISVTTNISGASIKITSGASTSASVVAEGVATGTSFTTANKLAPGEYTVEVSKKGYDTQTIKVSVDGDKTIDVTLVESIKTGASAEVTNAIPGYPNTVLVNGNAIVTVNMRDKEGNLLANKLTVLTLGKTTQSGSEDPELEVKGLEVATTDANGNATFVVGSKISSKLKANDTKYVSSVRYTANVLGDEASATGSISFAAIDVDKPTVATATSNLKAGTSASKSGYTGGSMDIATTTNLNDEPAQYILTQQVSSKDIDNSVQFKVEPSIVLPEVNDDVKAKDYYQDLSKYVSEKYHTYANDSQYFNLDVDTSLLSYASLNFNKLQLSPYTEMDIEYYTTYDASGNPADTDQIKADDLEGMEKNNFAVQIPLKDEPIKSIKVILKSAGQVQDNKNDGYSLKDITGVYKDVAGSKSTREVLKSAKITWNAVDPTYSETKSLEYTRATKADGLGIKPEHDTDTFTYAVPVFPNTGNAVITEKDINGKLVAYYLVPTENQKEKTGKENTNDIKQDSKTKKDCKAYKATEEEVSNYIKTGVTQNENGTLVKADSDKSGITTLKGELKIEGMDDLNLLDASNSNFYTSVQWNPIPNAQSTADAFLAIAGQKVTITGQLVDKNGNAVSLSGKNITFNKDGNEITSDNNVTVVKKAAPTDTNGKSTIVLSAAQAVEFLNVTASCADSNYNVKLSIGNTTVNNADLYWVNADLQFLSSVGEGTFRKADNKDIINTTSNDTIDVDVKDPTVGTPWEYGVKAVAGKIAENDENGNHGQLAGYTIDIDGLKIFTEYSDENKGKYTAVEGEKGKVVGSSEIANKDRISAKINGDSVTDKVTFIATDKYGKSLPPFTCVGEGTPNMNAKINMNVKWQPKGVTISMIAPQGTTMKGDTVKLYVRLTDSTGKSPLSEQEVEIASGNAGDKLASTKDEVLGATAGKSVKVTTNKYGVAEVWVKARDIDEDYQSSIITAKVDEMEQTASTTINWLNDDKTPAFGVVKAAKTDEKQVTVIFNHDINGDTVKAGNFKLTGENASGKEVQYDVTSVKASGNSAVLTLSETLPAGKYTVAINNNYSVDGIVYTPADVVGQTIDSTDGKLNKVDFYSAKTATFDLELNDDKDGFVIKNMNSPVDIMDDTASPAKVDNNTDKTKDFVITVNGEIVDQSTAFVKYTGSDDDVSKATFTFKLSDIASPASSYDGKFKAGTVVKVYYMGTVESYTISNNDVAGAVIDAMVAESGNNSITAGAAPAYTDTILLANGFGYTVKVVADDGDDSLYTTDNEKNKSYTNLDTIIADTVGKRLTGVVLTGLTTVNPAPTTSGKYVKLAVTFYDNANILKGKVIDTKYLKLISNGSGYALSK
ncbi:MAG: carboxypeptidase-like regulatory domain-containing protein [Lachnospiraceae bacterium]|nr:carboxypeptidase-like regulatory domain-containing protein [Lachnospiraceae bacterium]